jgi:hypothetical protein
MPYTVFVDDNYHYMDESYRYKLGDFLTWEDAVNAAKALVDEFLIGNRSRIGNARELFEAYCHYGEDPFIDSEGAWEKFSARKYAEQRCKELYEQ